MCRMPGQAPAARSAEHTTTCFLGGSRSRTSRARHRVFDVHDAGRQLIGQRCKYSKYILLPVASTGQLNPSSASSYSSYLGDCAMRRGTGQRAHGK